MSELELIIKKANKLWNLNIQEIKYWLNFPHTSFNGATPLEMINRNLGYKVISYIEDREEALK